MKDTANKNNGQILLEPQATVPASEAWLFNNPETLALVRRGLDDAAHGRVSEIDLDSLERVWFLPNQFIEDNG